MKNLMKTLRDYNQELENSQREILKRIARTSFRVFVTDIFSLSVDILKDNQWVGGQYIDDIANWYEGNQQTIRVSARDHFKSMAFYAHIMWTLFKSQYENKNTEVQYFSYNLNMAAYHTGKIKKAIACNPYFNGLIDKKTAAESKIAYTWDDNKLFEVTPRGLMEFKRGIHSEYVYVDDPLQDPDNKLIPTKIQKINDIMNKQILDMWQKEIHIAGTPQTNFDFFFNKEFRQGFSVRIQPAIISDKDKIVIWPEWMSYEALMVKKSQRGEKVFNQEYLCSPVYTEEAFLPLAKLEPVINSDLKNYNISQWEREIKRREEAGEETENNMYAGWDLGKSSHPSHFCIFEDIDGNYIERHSKWFDGVDYTDQLDYVQTVCEAMGVDTCYYDNTRGELEMAMEQGDLIAEMEPIHFTFKKKHAMATSFAIAVENTTVQLLDEPRQNNQIAMVTNDLDAPVTPEGHADSFWSIAMVFLSKDAQGVNITFA